MLTEQRPQMQAPVEKLLELNQNADARMLFEAREKERRDNLACERGACERVDGKGCEKVIHCPTRLMTQNWHIDLTFDLLQSIEVIHHNRVLNLYTPSIRSRRRCQQRTTLGVPTDRRGKRQKL